MAYLKCAEDEEASCSNRPLIYDAKSRKSSIAKDNDVQNLELVGIKNVETSSSASKETKNKNKDIPVFYTSHEPKKQRVCIDLTEDTEEQKDEAEVKIKIPEIVKSMLVHDWDMITQQKKLIIIPPRFSVSQIVDNFVEYKKSKNLNFSQRQKHILNLFGVTYKAYFDAVLGSYLFYNFERPQYSEILSKYPGTPVAQLYGSIHLLRMFVKMDDFLECSSLDEASFNVLFTNTKDLLKYMINNRHTLFSSEDYRNATPEYIRNVEED